MNILGIDIGGSGIKGAIVNTQNGELITERHRIETPQPATPKAVIDSVLELVNEFDWQGPIGCGFPASVKHEIIMTAANIDKSWIGLNAAKEISKATGCPTTLLNDVDAAGYAEIAFGAGKNENGVAIVIALGTGIGTAIFSEKVLLPNTELGHLIYKEKIAEHYASNRVRKEENLSWSEWGLRLNEYLNEIERLFWPDLLILGGGVSKKYQEFSEYLDVKTKIVPAFHKNNAGIIGAAIAAKHNLNLVF